VNSRLVGTARIALALLAGAGLYHYVVVYVGGVLAAVAVPAAYFRWFGRSKVELALALADTATFAVPVALLVAGGVLAAYRALRGPPWPFIVAIFAGAFLCFAFWVWWLAAMPLPEPHPDVEVVYSISFYSRVLQLLVPPWWAVPNFLAPWLGLALSSWLLQRAARS
jgi:hypothetical protein